MYSEMPNQFYKRSDHLGKFAAAAALLAALFPILSYLNVHFSNTQGAGFTEDSSIYWSSLACVGLYLVLTFFLFTEVSPYKLGILMFLLSGCYVASFLWRVVSDFVFEDKLHYFVYFFNIIAGVCWLLLGIWSIINSRYKYSRLTRIVKLSWLPTIALGATTIMYIYDGIARYYHPRILFTLLTSRIELFLLFILVTLYLSANTIKFRPVTTIPVNHYSMVPQWNTAVLNCCPHCGQPLDYDSYFCKKCGSRI
ncbi:MAG: zinc ribbon domain-containing protein [Eubacteriales bacterium]|nr:zinc ribbon domain-containing protein [Eubacteriales bacterium]